MDYFLIKKWRLHNDYMKRTLLLSLCILYFFCAVYMSFFALEATLEIVAQEVRFNKVFEKEQPLISQELYNKIQAIFRVKKNVERKNIFERRAEINSIHDIGKIWRMGMNRLLDIGHSFTSGPRGLIPHEKWKLCHETHALNSHFLRVAETLKDQRYGGCAIGDLHYLKLPDEFFNLWAHYDDTNYKMWILILKNYIEIMECIDHVHHDIYLTSLYNLGVLNQALGNYLTAAEWYTRCWNHGSVLFGKDNIQVGLCARKVYLLSTGKDLNGKEMGTSIAVSDSGLREFIQNEKEFKKTERDDKKYLSEKYVLGEGYYKSWFSAVDGSNVFWKRVQLSDWSALEMFRTLSYQFLHAREILPVCTAPKLVSDIIDQLYIPVFVIGCTVFLFCTVTSLCILWHQRHMYYFFYISKPNPPQQMQEYSALMAENLEKICKCPITYELFKDPVLCADGITYERTALDQWLQTHNNLPVYRHDSKFPENAKYIPNVTFLNLVAELKRRNIIADDED